MTKSEIRSQAALLAFKALTKGEQQKVIGSMLADRTLTSEQLEDIMDAAVADQRKNEPGRPLREILDEAGGARRVGK